MADYNYDESGSMFAYFLMSFLAIVLIPTTFSSLLNQQKSVQKGCQCKACEEQRGKLRRQTSSFNVSTKTALIIAGWGAFGFLAYRVAGNEVTNSVYNPFEILGIGMSASEKEIKSHYKKLSKVFHPDKVKLKANETLETASNYFVELTKAYKALTNEEIRENVRKYGHPDGRRDVTMGIAIPPWFIQNHTIVLGIYAVLFGGALPMLVGKWWFGNRQQTKDGIQTKSAAVFFKSVKEDSTMEDITVALTKAYQFEVPVTKAASSEVKQLEKTIDEQGGALWKSVKKANGGKSSTALVLVFAHFLRLPVKDSRLQKAQRQIVLQTPVLLNAMVNIVSSRNWLLQTLAVMRLPAYIVQALVPGNTTRSKWAQLPGVSVDESLELSATCNSVRDVSGTLQSKSDSRLTDVKTASEVWKRPEIVDASFKVIGERIVTPSSFVFLVVKLRLPSSAAEKTSGDATKEEDVEQVKKRLRFNDEKDAAFLDSKKDMEDISPERLPKITAAHAPHWPGNRKPSWWIVLADDKANRVVVPPIKISDIPLSDPAAAEHDRDYRSYKIQFQAPPNVGLFTWKVYVISDTYVDDDVTRDVNLKIDDVSALTSEEMGNEDDISEPDEDSLAGQMAILKGGKVKAGGENGAESEEDESDTDGDESEGSSSDSDSD